MLRIQLNKVVAFKIGSGWLKTKETIESVKVNGEPLVLFLKITISDGPLPTFLSVVGLFVFSDGAQRFDLFTERLIGAQTTDKVRVFIYIVSILQKCIFFPRSKTIE
jgi:hypothetical protein